MLPDVTQDAITDCAKRIGTQFIERVFYEAARDANFPNPQDRAQALYRVWLKDGYATLPQFVKDFVLRTTEGQYHGNPSERL